MLDDLKNRISVLNEFDFGNELEIIVEKNTELIADLQRDQMLEGRGVDGEYIRPFYSEDPYFKSAEAAERYAKWKERITPNPQRPTDVPNLYIDGTFHNSLFVTLSEGQFEISSNAAFGEKVFDDHKNAQGLNEDKRLLFAENVTLPAIKDALKTKTGLTIK